MGLVIGTQIGPYEVLSAIGAGGMGEVYLGRDTRLDRDVAIKVLPGEFARDVERVSRFVSTAVAEPVEQRSGGRTVVVGGSGVGLEQVLSCRSVSESRFAWESVKPDATLGSKVL